MHDEAKQFERTYFVHPIPAQIAHKYLIRGDPCRRQGPILRTRRLAKAHGGKSAGDGGVDRVSVREILGHRDIETTLRYAHLAPGHLRDAVNRGSLAGTVTTEKQAVGERVEVVDSVARPTGLEPVTPRSVEGKKPSNPESA